MINADAVLHRDRDIAVLAHGRDAVTHQRGLGHEAGTKAAVLYAIRRASAVEVDLVVTPFLAERGTR